MSDEKVKSPREFFESVWFKDATQQLCVDGWPSFIVPLNIGIRETLEAYDQVVQERDQLKAKNEELQRYKNGYDNLEIENRKLRLDSGIDPLIYDQLKAKSEKLVEALRKCSNEMVIARNGLEAKGIGNAALNEGIFLADQALAEFGEG